jgi:glutathione synthase/RimK-type ligase-like ATP-grasp enzyme
LTGHSGSGIVIARDPLEIVDAPLYTKAAKHKDEYRVHVFKGEVIDVQKKKRKLNWEGPTDSGIRNLANGWVYARSDVSVPTKVIDAAVDAVNTLGLDFGAVDIGYNQHLDKAILFEINTAPGLFGTTLEKYKEVFTKYMEEH